VLPTNEITFWLELVSEWAIGRQSKGLERAVNPAALHHAAAVPVELAGPHDSYDLSSVSRRLPLVFVLVVLFPKNSSGPFSMDRSGFAQRSYIAAGRGQGREISNNNDDWRTLTVSLSWEKHNVDQVNRLFAAQARRDSRTSYQP
jgi:hypothetical protein